MGFGNRASVDHSPLSPRERADAGTPARSEGRASAFNTGVGFEILSPSLTPQRSTAVGPFPKGEGARSGGVPGLAILAMVCVFSAAAETPRIGLKSAPVGPLVDVTLKSGETTKGQLVSFAGGSLVLKLDNGDTLSKDGAEVVSVRFIAGENSSAGKESPSSQETQLLPEENRKLAQYRVNERKNTITRDEETDYKRLRTKVEVHIKALEREIPKVKDTYEAQGKLSDLMRSYFLIGTQPEIVKSNIKVATNSIENESVRDKTQAAMPAIIQKLEDDRRVGPKPNRPLNKLGEKLIDKTNPTTPEKKTGGILDARYSGSTSCFLFFNASTSRALYIFFPLTIFVRNAPPSTRPVM